MEVKRIIWRETRTPNFDGQFISGRHGEMGDGYLWAHFRVPSGFIYALTYSSKHIAR